MGTWTGLVEEDRPIDRADVLALLEDGPQGAGLLAKWLRQPQSRVLAACRALAREGVILCLPHPDRRWALPTFDAAADKARRIAASADARKPPLRQLKKGATTMKKDEAPSWWATAAREGFTARAAGEIARMQTSKQCYAISGTAREYGLPMKIAAED